MRRLPALLLLCLLTACGTVAPTAPPVVLVVTATPAPASAPTSPPAPLPTDTTAPPAPTNTTAPPAPPTNTSAPTSEAPITIKGSGISKSKPFPLAGGNYTVRWTATATSSVGCYHGGSLRAVDPTVFMFESIGNAMVKTTATGETQVYNVTAGQYYLDMSSGCDWTVTIGPQ